MTYQLILQFRAESLQDFDELVLLEELLLENLPLPSRVDGHDFGKGEFNIFILTDQPRESFRDVERIIQHYRPQQSLKAAFRERGRDGFVVLWPPGLHAFEVS